jgi:hypothetical protein
MVGLPSASFTAVLGYSGRNWPVAAYPQFAWTSHWISLLLLPQLVDSKRLTSGARECAPRARRNQSPAGRHDANIASNRFVSTLKSDCGAKALNSSEAERGNAVAIVAVATSATIIDSNQKKAAIANLVK